MVENPPAMQEMQVRSLGGEDPLEEVMATTPVFLPGKSHGQRSLVGGSPWVTKVHGVTSMCMQKAGTQGVKSHPLTTSKPAVFHLAFTNFSLGVRRWEWGCGGRGERLSSF